MQIKIRRAEKRDIKPLEAVINEHWKVNIDHRKEIADKNAILLVVETADGSSHTTRKVVGTGLMWVTKWNKTGYLVELAVSKDSMRKGVGKALVSEFARLARRHRLRAIIVETQPDNKDGMDFYLANGFRLCGYNDRYYTNRPRSSHEIAVFFSLDLNGSAK